MQSYYFKMQDKSNRNAMLVYELEILGKIEQMEGGESFISVMRLINGIIGRRWNIIPIIFMHYLGQSE